MTADPHDGRFAGPEQLAEAERRYDELVAYHLAAHTHLWSVLTAHALSDVDLELLNGGTLTTSASMMLGTPQVGCYLCETPYSRRDRHRRCKGEAPE